MLLTFHISILLIKIKEYRQFSIFCHICSWTRLPFSLIAIQFVQRTSCTTTNWYIKDQLKHETQESWTPRFVYELVSSVVTGTSAPSTYFTCVRLPINMIRTRVNSPTIIFAYHLYDMLYIFIISKN